MYGINAAYQLVGTVLRSSRSSKRMVLTSSLAALLHAVLVDVKREQHVGVAALLLLHIGSAGAACGDGSVQEEGGFLSRRGTQLALILKLWGGTRQRTGSE